MDSQSTGRCKTCAKWEHDAEFYTLRHDGRVKIAGGICISEKLTEDYSDGQERGCDELVYPYNEGGHFWTGPEFGCVHHEQISNGQAEWKPG